MNISKQNFKNALFFQAQVEAYSLQYNRIQEGHFKCEDLEAAVGRHVLHDIKTSDIAFCRGQNLR